jgi:hypothetical protein
VTPPLARPTTWRNQLGRCRLGDRRGEAQARGPAGDRSTVGPPSLGRQLPRLERLGIGQTRQRPRYMTTACPRSTFPLPRWSSAPPAATASPSRPLGASSDVHRGCRRGAPRMQACAYVACRPSDTSKWGSPRDGPTEDRAAPLRRCRHPGADTQRWSLIPSLADRGVRVRCPLMASRHNRSTRRLSVGQRCPTGISWRTSISPSPPL